MKLLVFEYKVVDYQYFMDEMREYELGDILNNLEASVQDDWEKTRIIAFWAARPHYKRLKPTDVLTFRWDEKKDPYDDMLSSYIKLDDNDKKSLKDMFANAKLP